MKRRLRPQGQSGGGGLEARSAPQRPAASRARRHGRPAASRPAARRAGLHPGLRGGVGEVQRYGAAGPGSPSSLTARPLTPCPQLPSPSRPGQSPAPCRVAGPRGPGAQGRSRRARRSPLSHALNRASRGAGSWGGPCLSGGSQGQRPVSAVYAQQTRGSRLSWVPPPWGGGGCHRLAVGRIVVASSHLPNWPAPRLPPFLGRDPCYTPSVSPGGQLWAGDVKAVPFSSLEEPALWLLADPLSCSTPPGAYVDLPRFLTAVSHQHQSLGPPALSRHGHSPVSRPTERGGLGSELLQRVEVGALGRADQSRSQQHMAGFAGSAPKGSSGREVLLGPCLQSCGTSLHLLTSPRQGEAPPGPGPLLPQVPC